MWIFPSHSCVMITPTAWSPLPPRLFLTAILSLPSIEMFYPLSHFPLQFATIPSLLRFSTNIWRFHARVKISPLRRFPHIDNSPTKMEPFPHLDFLSPYAYKCVTFPTLRLPPWMVSFPSSRRFTHSDLHSHPIRFFQRLTFPLSCDDSSNVKWPPTRQIPI